MMISRIENIDDKYLDGLSSIGIEEYDRIFKLAKDRALAIFQEWNEITGVFPPETSYYFEVESCIIDAVHCGVQRALGIQVPIMGEDED